MQSEEQNTLRIACSPRNPHASPHWTRSDREEAGINKDDASVLVQSRTVQRLETDLGHLSYGAVG